MSTSREEAVLARTRWWLERIVIGLNLCPFARAPTVQRRVRIVCSPATDADALEADLVQELTLLRDTPADVCETTLLVHPHVLQDFTDYNGFLDRADACLVGLELEGELQIASFHPDYVFAGEPPDDISHATNRAPYPVLHLLREASIARVVDAIDDPDAIYRRNIETLRALGRSGWEALWAEAPAGPVGDPRLMTHLRGA